MIECNLRPIDGICDLCLLVVVSIFHLAIASYILHSDYENTEDLRRDSHINNTIPYSLKFLSKIFMDFMVFEALTKILYLKS